MKVVIYVTRSFAVAVKPLLKKYPSLKKELLHLEAELIKDPHKGIALGLGAYKIRLKISSKGRGKSGGARVITLVEIDVIGDFEIQDQQITVNLLTIYDKADTANITDKELKDLIRAFYGKG